MANTFQLRIVASNKVFYDGDCKSLILPVADGGLCGFLANHENTVAPIEFGEMKITTSDDKIIEAFIGNGFLEFFDNVASVVCISAELPDEIDKRRAEEAKHRAEEKLRQKQSIYEYNESKASVARAMERIKVKKRHQI